MATKMTTKKKTNTLPFIAATAAVPTPTTTKTLPFAATPTGTGSYTTAGGTNAAAVAKPVTTPPPNSLAVKPATTKTSALTPVSKSGGGGGSSQPITMGGVISDKITEVLGMDLSTAMSAMPIAGVGMGITKTAAKSKLLNEGAKLLSGESKKLIDVANQVIRTNAPYFKFSRPKFSALNDMLLRKVSASPNVWRDPKTGIAVNAKTLKLSKDMFLKTLTPKTLLVAGGTLATAASIMFIGKWSTDAAFMGQWAQAEAPEPLTIVMKDILWEAKKTGDWTLYDEASVGRDEIIYLDVWEKMGLWTPFAPGIGTPNKIEGSIKAAEFQNKFVEKLKAEAIIMDKTAEDLKIQQETGETEDEKWVRLRQEQADQEKANIDYYNQERKKMVEWENAAKAAAGKASSYSHRRDYEAEAAFWAAEKEKQRKLEEEDRIAIGKFWMDYKKQQQRMYDDSRPSKLNFGFL